MKYSQVSAVFDGDGLQIVAATDLGTSGPCVTLALTREAADSLWRDIANELDPGLLEDIAEVIGYVLHFPRPQVPHNRVAHYQALAAEAARSSFYDQDA